MDTIIIPGFSIKNKDWAEETKKQLDSAFPTTVHYWRHWNTGTVEPDWKRDEVNVLKSLIGNNKVNVIAKSIGTLVLTHLLRDIPENIDKIILCGIPMTDLDENDKKDYEILTDFPTGKILCIQNENDNHGSFEEAKKFLESIDPNIKIIFKPRDDHEYPYYDDFRTFLN